MSTDIYDPIKDNILSRLKKIEGQSRGIQNMIESSRTCKDVLDQIYALRTAIDKVSSIILENYINARLGTIEDLSKNDELFQVLKIINRDR